MKAILLCALAAVAASQFASSRSPAEVILQRQGNRAILRVPESFSTGSTFQSQGLGHRGSFGGQGTFQSQDQGHRGSFGGQRQSTFQSQGQGHHGSFGGHSTFQRNERRNPFQRGSAVSSQQQQQQHSQSFQQGQTQVQSQQRARVQPSTILAGGSSRGVQLTGQQQQQQQLSLQQQQQIQREKFQREQSQREQFQREQYQREQSQREQSQREQFQSHRVRSDGQYNPSDEVQGVFEPLNLPSGASLLLGQISTEFSCNDRPYGYYGDDANNCLVFHICYPALFESGKIETYQYSFMCGEGTQFDQKELACVSHETALNCGETQSWYHISNSQFGLQHERTK